MTVYTRLTPLLRTGLALLLFMPAASLAAEADVEQSVWFWNLVIALIVMLVTMASAALPLAALRQWHGGWFITAAAPIAVLVMWGALIFLSRLDNPNSHRLWPFEIFSWAMINMIYMVALMTYKRKVDRAREAIEGLGAFQGEADASSSDSDQAS
jgi:cation transport ATPase